ncbi:MAG TPA: sulfite exporter TauE/SafE family protein [Bryobacteraceae bacterium]|nr:sulfite exporter TauE/SafE family protein [Bryobacteraceae bacterium]
MASTWSIVLLCAAAFAGGAVNAIAGGGTLLTFPSLLALLSPVSANATSTMALLPGSLAAGFGFRRELAKNGRILMFLWPPSLVGGILGSILLIRMPEKVFAAAVPWLLVGASVLLLLQKPLARHFGAHPHEPPQGGRLAAIVAFQLMVGIYGGYFGAGIGILMLSSLAFAGISDIHGMNAVKSILAATMNGVTAIILAWAGVVNWKYAAMMAAAAIVGGYAGARVARRMRPDYVRVIVVAIGFGVAAYSWVSSR